MPRFATGQLSALGPYSSIKRQKDLRTELDELMRGKGNERRIVDLLVHGKREGESTCGAKNANWRPAMAQNDCPQPQASKHKEGAEGPAP